MAMAEVVSQVNTHTHDSKQLWLVLGVFFYYFYLFSSVWLLMSQIVA